MPCKQRFSPRLLPRWLSWPCTLVFSVGAVSTVLHWRLLYTSALASRQLPCCLQTSAACLLCQTWLCPALFDAMPSCLSFTPCLLPWAVLHACVSDPSTQSPDALFSIVLKPPTRVFFKHRLGVLLFHFRIRGFKTTASGFSNHRPVVHNTDRGFLEHRPVFQSGFHYLCTDFRTIGRGFSTPSCFLSPHTDGVFYASLISFSPYRS